MKMIRLGVHREVLNCVCRPTLHLLRKLYRTDIGIFKWGETIESTISFPSLVYRLKKYTPYHPGWTLRAVAISDSNNHNGLQSYYKPQISGAQRRMIDNTTYFGSTFMALPPNLL